MRPLSVEERRFVEEHLNLVYAMAWRTPVGEYNDRVQDGTLGLIEALRRHDPALGVFTTYALTLIRGRILDGHRRRVHDRRRRTVTFVSLDPSPEDHDHPNLLDTLADPASGPEDQALDIVEGERRAKALYLALAKLRPILVDAIFASPEWAGQQKAGGERLAEREQVTGGAITRRKQSALKALRELLHDL